MLVLTALLLLTSCGAFEPPDADPPVPVEYPLEHYRVTDRPADFGAWKAEVRALRTRLREERPFEENRPELQGRSRESELLDTAVDPAAIIWKDPAAFWREPLNLAWWELIDRNGRIEKVFVITSNQTPDVDARIIAWCLEGKAWEPAIVDGEPRASIRSASINLGESNWHVAYWMKKVSEESAAVLLVMLIAIGVRGGWALVERRRRRRAQE